MVIKGGIMKIKKITAITIVVIIVIGVAISSFYIATNAYNPPPQIIMPQGSAFNITNSSEKYVVYMNPGTANPYPETFYGGTIFFNVTARGELIGSWSSAKNCTVYVTLYMSLRGIGQFTPVSEYGSFNQTIFPGKYNLTYIGYPNEKIVFKTNLEVNFYTPKSISSLYITPQKMYSGQMTYYFSLKENGTLFGWALLWNPSSLTVMENTSSGPTSIASASCSRDTGNFSIGFGTVSDPAGLVLSAGNYSLSFSSNNYFTVNYTFEVLNIIDTPLSYDGMF
jgi:hypothetical protein